MQGLPAFESAGQKLDVSAMAGRPVQGNLNIESKGFEYL